MRNDTAKSRFQSVLWSLNESCRRHQRGAATNSRLIAGCCETNRGRQRNRRVDLDRGPLPVFVGRALPALFLPTPLRAQGPVQLRQHRLGLPAVALDAHRHLPAVLLDDRPLDLLPGMPAVQRHRPAAQIHLLQQPPQAPLAALLVAAMHVPADSTATEVCACHDSRCYVARLPVRVMGLAHNLVDQRPSGAGISARRLGRE